MPFALTLGMVGDVMGTYLGAVGIYMYRKTITLHVFVSLSDCKEADALFGLMSFSKRYWRKAVERNTQTPVSGAQTLEQFSHAQLPI